MEHYYEAANTTRQAFHAWRMRHQQGTARPVTSEQEVLHVAHAIRRVYLPGAGVRVVYNFIKKHPEKAAIQLQSCGKHRFEQICLSNGMRVTARRYIPRTTHRGEVSVPNLIEGLVISDINRIWVSDITYVFGNHGNLLGYAPSMIDLYSRRLLGLSFSRTMRAEETSLRSFDRL